MSGRKTKEAYNAYMRVYVLERYHRRRAAAIERLGGECVACGTTDTLEFDHIDPITKTFDIAKGGAGFSEVRWLAEVEKCQLLCHEHHLEKTLRNQEGRTNPPRGERVGGSKLNEADVLEIRRLAVEGWQQVRIAEKFNVTPGNVRFIVNRLTWCHI